MTGPLTGYRVLDFASALAGPWAAGILADQGADVIKIEPPGGDLYRSSGTLHGGMSAMFHLANRGKRSIVVDLRHQEGRSLACDLAEGADVVVQNYRPGVAERLGVGYDDLRRRREDLVFVAVSGFGPDGPSRDRPAFDSVVQAESGMCAAEAASGGDPRLIGQTIADKVTALNAAQAAVAGLLARRDGHGGQRIDVPMLDVSVAFLWMDSAGRETLLDADPRASSTMSGSRRPVQFADGWCMIGIGTDAHFREVCAVMTLDPQDYTAIATGAGRATRRDVMATFMKALGETASRMPLASATSSLRERGVPVGVVTPVAEVPSDPHVVATGLFEESHHPAAGRIRQPRPPVRFAATPTTASPTSPALGEHTDEVLAELGRRDVADLRRRGVVG